MKIISASRHHLLLLCVCLLATACDLQQTFDERIDDKQLLVLTPDFADTSVQLVFRDSETLAVLDEDFEVTVYANKRLVDLNGNFKTSFKVKNGSIFFFIHPEESVSPTDPLEMQVLSLNGASNPTAILAQDISITSPGNNSVTITLEQGLDSNLEPESTESTMISKATRDDVKVPKLIFNYNKPESSISYEERIEFFSPSEMPKSFPLGFYSTPLFYPSNEVQLALSLLGIDLSFKSDQTLSISLEKLSAEEWALIKNYTFKAFYLNSEGAAIFYSIGRDGRFTLKRYNEQRFVDGEESINNSLNGINTSTGIEILSLDPGFTYGLFTLVYELSDEDRMICKEGFNLNFEFMGVDPSFISPLFRTTMADGKTSLISSVNLSEDNNTFNSTALNGDHLFSRSSNRLEFAENSQYIIEPQVIDLGGEEACGNTYTVQLKRRDTHKKHQLNLSMRNENQNVGLALTFSALLRKQGQDNTAWETVNFKQGSTSLFLEEGNTYEVKLTLADEPFEFTFTNDLSLVEAAVQATLRNVTRIKDIKYTINQTADLNTIDAEILFYEGQSLID